MIWHVHLAMCLVLVWYLVVGGQETTPASHGILQGAMAAVGIFLALLHAWADAAANVLF